MKVLLNVIKKGDGIFDIYSDDLMLSIDSWNAPLWNPKEYEADNNRVDGAIRLKKAEFSDDAILEILKGK